MPLARAVQPGNLPVNEADPLPLYELGIGGAGAMLPDYPGSNQDHFQSLPFPYAIYRGEILRSERRGSPHARFFKSDIIEVNMSASAGLPADSSRNEARQGMPNLDWLGELGPRVGVRMNRWENGAVLKLGFAVRGVLSTDFTRVDGRGFIFVQEVQFDYPDFPFQGANGFVLLTVNAADRRYMQYFYEVEPQFARPGRPTYQARGGYFVSDITFGVTLPVIEDHLHFIAFTTLGSYAGSANASSPLMKASTDTSEVIALIWTIERSREKTRFQ